MTSTPEVASAADAGPRPGRLSRWAGRPASVRRRVLNRVLLLLPVPTRRRAQYLLAHGRFLHLRRPRLWSEKVNWRMVHDRRALIALTCDKAAAREFVAATVTPGTLRLPRIVWCGDDMSGLTQVSWPEHWVFKSNHGTGAVVMGEGQPDAARLAELAGLGSRWLRDRGPERWGEWGYGRARRMVLVEEAVPGTPPTGLADHKFFVVDGEVRLVQVDTDRFGSHRRRFYTASWGPLDAVCEVPLGPVSPAPVELADMLVAAERLAAGFDFLRVDLYAASGSVWFGELTAYSGSGLSPLRPVALDRLLGDAWTLPRLDRTGTRLLEPVNHRPARRRRRG